MEGKKKKVTSRSTEELVLKNQINTSSMFSHKPNGCKREFSRFSYMVLFYLYTTY